tara:strand:+ start:3704 stop:3925 length:222 start_codon:yes stop_codon:yes gene_type:complete
MNEHDVLSAIHNNQPIAIKSLAAEIGLDHESTRRWIKYLRMRNMVSFGAAPYRCRLTSRGQEYLLLLKGRPKP